MGHSRSVLFALLNQTKKQDDFILSTKYPFHFLNLEQNDSTQLNLNVWPTKVA
jgi:hypothetical protein